MVIFLNMDGTGEVVTPERVFQGSNNVTEITAIAPFSADTRLEIGFILPNGLYWTNSDGARYVPMEFAAKDNDKNVTAWSFTLPFSVTEQVGKAWIAINATTTTGNTTSYLCEFTVEESVLPNKPPAPDPSVYEYLSLYLARLDGRTANVPNLVWKIRKVGGNSFTYTDNKGIVSEITLGEIDYEPTYVGAASVVKIPVDAWQEVRVGQAVTGYTATITAGQHGQMQDGVTPNDLWLSFDETENGVISGVYQSYTVDDAGDITLNVTTPVALTVRVWNGKGLKDTIARDAITAETERAEAVETQLQAQIDDIVESGVDKTAREQIAAEAERATAAENALNEKIETNTADIQGLREDIENESHFRGMFDSVAALIAAYPTATPHDYAYIVGGNIYIWQDGAWTDSNKPSPNTAVPLSDSTPLMDGVASAGTSSAAARGDHRHGSDTSKVNKSGDSMTGTLTMTGQNYPHIIIQSGAAAANGKTVFLEQQNNGTFVIVGRTVDDTVNNRYAVRVPENDGTIALLDASGNFTAPIVQANNAFLLGENTGSNSQGRIENNAAGKSLDILAPNPTTGAYEVSAKNRGGAYAVFRAKEVYEGTNRVYSPKNPNTKLIYSSNNSITIAAGGEATIYSGSSLSTGDIVQIVGYLGPTYDTSNVVNIMFPITTSGIYSLLQYTGVAYKTSGGYTGRFEIYLNFTSSVTDSLIVRNVREYQPNNTGSNIQMTILRVYIRRFAQ